MDGIIMVFWYWWVLAFFLLAIELLAPGFFFLWLAIASFFTGGIVLVLPILSLTIQLLLFAVLAVISIILWKVFAVKYPVKTDQPLLNKRGTQYIGSVFTLTEPIQNGQGKIKVGDSLWKVQGEDCPINSRVKVTAIQGTVFTVEKVA